MSDVFADLVFLALSAAGWTLLYREVLPRVLAREARARAVPSQPGPGLSGPRFLVWVVATTMAVLSLIVGYHLLRLRHPSSIVLAVAVLLSWACILSGHRLHRMSENEAIPEVRFGAFLGWCIGGVLYFALATTVLPHP